MTGNFCDLPQTAKANAGMAAHILHLNTTFKCDSYCYSPLVGGKYCEITITSRIRHMAFTATACHKNTHYLVIREGSLHQHGITSCLATNSPSAQAHHSPCGVLSTEVSRRKAGCRIGRTKDTTVLDPCNSGEVS
jgi:hypothetical protein